MRRYHFTPDGTLFRATLVYLSVHLAAISLLAPAVAQAPIAAYGVAYTTDSEKTFYIQGGCYGVSPGSSQFFSLDLKSSWSTSNVPWKAMSTGNSLQGAPDTCENWMVLSNGTLIDFGWDGIYSYSITSASWQAKRPWPIASYYFGMHAAIDPNTGAVYVPTGTNSGTQMSVYYPSNGNSLTTSMPVLPEGSNIVTYYGLVWSSVRNSLLLYGGRSFQNGGTNYSVELSNPYLYEFLPSTSTWRQLTTNGPGPGDIHGHCMVEAYGGSKIVLFGGTTLNGPSVANIYTLDVNSMSWTKGPSGDSSQNREQMACSVSGDNFVTWGGQNWDTHTTTLVKTTGVFNMASSQWTSQYDARPASGPSSRPSPGSSSGSNTGAIVGGVVGGVVILAAVGFVFYRRRKIIPVYQTQNISHLQTAGYMNSPPALTTTEYPTTPFPAGNTPMYPTAWQVTPPVKGPNFQDPDEVK